MNLGRLVIGVPPPLPPSPLTLITPAGSFELLSYAWVYEHCRLVSLPWDSPLTWWLALLAYDFLFYWFHRMAHGTAVASAPSPLSPPPPPLSPPPPSEVNLFWAAHQVHHSSEEYNLSTALRQSVLQRFTSFVCTCICTYTLQKSIIITVFAGL